jgi:hypothetical protein
VIGDDGGAPLHLSMSQAGLQEDFSAEEEYNSCCETGSPWVAQKAQYPSVTTMTLAYNTDDPPPLNWSTLKYVFGQLGGPNAEKAP